MQTVKGERYNGPLHEMACTTRTDYWNDSCSVEELAYAIERGAVGATSNPAIVLDVLKKEMHLWKDRISQIIAQNPVRTEVEVAWTLVEEMAAKGAGLLHPVYVREKGRKGRLSIQTNPTFYRNAEAIVEQAVRFHGLAPNMQVKIPVTRAGVAAIEEATYRGVNVNATVCFTVPQALAVGAAVERGLRRREAEGDDVSSMAPVCTIMVGRLDDWLEVVARKERILVTPGTLAWAGIAAIKRAYTLYQERGWRTRLLAAAYRHHLHWTELVGGDIVLTIPWAWQKQFNASGFEVRERFFEPVPQAVLDELTRSFPDFVRAHEPDGMVPDEFDGFGATRRTLRSFIAAYHQLLAQVRDFMLPDPDLR